jgi:glycosyltransferase involved in cell wall biosynthesis
MPTTNTATLPRSSFVRPIAIIPTYNNAGTLAAVVAKTAEYLPDIIVVNDGSTDETKSVLAELAESNARVHATEFETNRGKGAALRAGFEKALALGFTHAITLDADGQHSAADIPAFLGSITLDPKALWIGDRVLDSGRTGQPRRSAAGRRFGSFWYKFITGLDIGDTQCGFRAFPLLEIAALACKGDRYEFEQEALVKAAWNGIPVKSVPVRLYYAPRNTAVSHFRPVRDFLRIFTVNSKAVIIKLFVPFLIVDMPGATWRQKIAALFRHELQAHSTPKEAAWSLSLGVFIGIFPIYGFQVLTVFALAMALRLNKPLAFLGVSISSLPFLPLIIAAAVAIGKLVVPRTWSAGFVHSRLAPYISGGMDWFFGSIILALGAAGICWMVSYVVFRGMRRGK